MDLPSKELNKLSDTELLQRCQEELPYTTIAYNELIKRYKDYIFGIAFKKLGNIQDAEDAAQETFIRMFSGIGKFRMEAEPKTWITKIVLNVCLSVSLTQKGKFWKHYVSLEGDTDLESIYHSLLSYEQEYGFWRKIGGILRKMYPDYRKIFILKYFKNFSLQKLTQKVGATLGAVKMKIKRAKDQFVRIFGEE